MGENDPIPVDPDFAGDIRRWIGRHWRIKPLHVAGMLWVAVLLLSPNANAQAVRFDTDVTTVSAQCVSGKQCPVLSLPGSIMSVCGGSVSTLASCLAAPATTYTDFSAGTPCPTTAQLTPQTGGACLSTADAEGNAGFWALPGQYNYFLRVPATAGGGTYGPYPVNVGASAGCPLGATCDASFSTLSAACTAAGTGTLYLTRTWSGLTTQTLACNIQALANGIVKPASGQTVTLSKSFNGDLTQHVDTSAGGVVSLAGKVAEVYVEWFGAATYTYASGISGAVNNCVPFTAASAALQSGGVLRFGNSKLGQAYYSTCAITQSKPAHYKGSGRGDDCPTSPTCLVFAAATNGVINANTSRGSSVEDMWLQSLSTGTGADNGLMIGDNWFYGHNLGIDGFGNDGVYNLSNNVDFMVLSQILSENNFGDGFFCSNSDCGEMFWHTLRSLSNHGYGYHGETGHSRFLNLDAEFNTLGAFNMSGLSNRFDSPYCEGASTEFTYTGDWSVVTSELAGACTFLNPGGLHWVSNQLMLNGHFANQLVVTDANPVTANPETYAHYSGVFGAKCYSIRDLTSSPNKDIFGYCPGGGTPTLEFPEATTFDSTVTLNGPVTFNVPVTLSNQTIKQTGSSPGLTLFKPDSSGADPENFILQFDGWNASSAQAHYGSIYTQITSNTPGSQTGKLHLATVVGGAPVDGITLDNGTAAIGSGTTIVYRCSVAGTARAGTLTTVSADCGTAVDTGLRVK